MSRDVFRFGDCTIRLAARELLRDGRRVNLSPVVFDCIAYLIRHRERAVGRDELVAAVWGKASISDAVMGKTILTARRAIGDTAEAQRFLRTVPRFGYQWVAPAQDAAPAPAPPAAPEAAEAVESVGPAEPVDAGESAAASSVSVATDAAAAQDRADVPASAAQQPAVVSVQAQPSRRRYLLLAVAAVALAVAVALAWHRWHGAGQSPATAAPDAASLPAELTIVLPVDVAASPADAWLRLGLMDLIATRLRAGGLAVLPSDNVVRLVPAGASREDALAAVAGIAGRRRVVAAAVRRSGDDWIVHAELLTPDGRTSAVEAQARDAMSAAGLLADHILDRSGRRVADPAARVAPTSAAELVQRVDAARLAGDPAQVRALIEAAGTDLRELPEVQLRVALIDLRTGGFDAARVRLDALAARVPAESDALLHARIQSYLCIALARVGRLADGEQACSRAIALLETRNEPADLGRAYSDRGITRLLLRQLDAAAQDFARARIALNLAGDALQLARVDGNESNLDMQQGRYGEVIAIQQRIGERFRGFGMNNEVTASLNNQTGAHLELLEPLAALTTSDRAFALLGRITDASIRYDTRRQRAETLERNGRLAEARVLLDELIAETAGDELASERALARALEARIDLAGGEPSTALLLARQAVAALPAPPYADARADAWLVVLRSLHASGRVDEAAAELKTFAAATTAGDSPDVHLLVAIAQAEQAVAERRPDAARSLYRDALAAAQRWGVPAALARVTTSYGRFLLAQGDLPEAASVIGLVARHAERDFDCAVLQAQLYRALGRREAAEAAIGQARALAGERPLPADLAVPLRPGAIGNGGGID